MGTTEIKELRARAVISDAIALLSKKGTIIVLEPKIEVEIADDSDSHRIRKGYMRYDSVLLLEANQKEWLLAIGTVTGQYPKDPYDCDLLVTQFSSKGKDDKQIKKEMCNLIGKSEYFTKSLIVVSAGGEFAFNTKRMSKESIDLFSQKLSEFSAQELETDPDVLTTSTLTPVIKHAALYKPEFVPIFSEILEKVLV